MKKLIYLTLLFLLVNVAFVTAAISLTSPTTNPVSGEPQDNINIAFQATNSGPNPISIIFTSTGLTDGTNTIQVPSKSQTLNAGETIPITMEVTLPSIKSGSYTGTIKAEEVGNASNSAISTAVSVTVLPVAKIELDKTSITITKPADSTGIEKFTIKNKGSVTFTPKVQVSGNLTDNDDDEIKVSITGVKEIAPDASITLTISADLPSGIDLATYDSDITITSDLYPSLNEVIDFKVKVEPEICSEGRKSDDKDINTPDNGNLRIKINEPDKNDDIQVGDDLNIEVNVDNKDDQDMDVVVEAILYNLDQDEEIATVDSSSKEIKDGKDEDFDLEMTIPSSNDLDEDDQIVLYVKAYEDGDEDINCNYDSVELDFKRESHQVVVEKFTISPSSVSCNELVNFVVGVENTGKKDQEDVEIRVTHPELGLDLVSNRFDLDKFDKSSNDASKSFSFLIPKNAAEKSYAIQAEVFFRNRDESNSATEQLTILNCNSGSGSLGTSGTSGDATLLQSSFSITPGRIFAIPVSLQNSGSGSATYQVQVNTQGGWASPVNEQSTLNSGQSTTVFAYLTPVGNLETGSYTASVTVLKNGNIILTDTISATVGGSSPTGSATFQGTYTFDSFTRNWIDNGRIFWILGIVMLLVLIAFFGKLVLKKN
jgi:hypothetical protein